MSGRQRTPKWVVPGPMGCTTSGSVDSLVESVVGAVAARMERRVRNATDFICFLVDGVGNKCEGATSSRWICCMGKLHAMRRNVFLERTAEDGSYIGKGWRNRSKTGQHILQILLDGPISRWITADVDQILRRSCSVKPLDGRRTSTQTDDQADADRKHGSDVRCRSGILTACWRRI